MSNDDWRGHRFITGGNTTLLRFGKILSNSPSGCPRRLLLRNLKIEPPIDADTRKIFQAGFDFEDYILMRLTKNGYEVAQDVKNKIVLSEITNWTVSADFVVNDETIVETKSTNTDKRAKDVFVHNKFKTEHMLQLANYLYSFQKDEGILMYGHMGSDYTYKYRGTTVEVPRLSIKQFFLTRKNGKFTWRDPDTEETGLFLANEQNIANTLNYLMWVLENDVYDCLEPEGFSEYMNPCKFCEFNKMCAKLPTSFEEFVGESKRIVETLEEDIKQREEEEAKKELESQPLVDDYEGDDIPF